MRTFYQPYVKPLVNDLEDKFENKDLFADTGFYQSFIQPIVADIDQYIYQPYFKPMQDKATDWWEATWDKYGERVHGALDAVGFIPGLGEIADGLNGLIYLGRRPLSGSYGICPGDDSADWRFR